MLGVGCAFEACNRFVHLKFTVESFTEFCHSFHVREVSRVNPRISRTEDYSKGYMGYLELFCNEQHALIKNPYTFYVMDE